MKSNIMRLWALAALVIMSLNFVSAVVVITPPTITTTTVIINQSVISSFNSTYDALNNTYVIYWYNHTSAANLSIFMVYDGRWSSTFNQTYQNFAYNQSHWNLSGSNLFTKDTAWRVGVGTSPTFGRFQVAGNITIGSVVDPIFILANTSAGSSSLSMRGSAGASRLAIGADGTTSGSTERVSIISEGSNAGFVGIATITPTSVFTVVGNVSISGNTSIDGDTFFVDTNNDRVGIGTPVPGTRLEVNKSDSNTEEGIIIRNQNTGVNAAPMLRFRAGAAAETATIIRFPSSHGSKANELFITNVGTTSPITLATQDTERVRIDSAGNFGIGTTNPLYPLTVQAAGNATNITIWASGNISATGFITRTHIWDDKKGSALNYFQNVSKFKKANGEINHSAYQFGYVTYPNQRQNGTYQKIATEQKQNITTNETGQVISYYNETTISILPTYETYMEEGVMLDSVVAKHEQAIYELNEKVKKMEATLCSLGQLQYC